MASVHRDPRYPKGVWYCLYRLADGRRVFRSTGKRNKREAEIVCQALQQTEDEAATGDLTKERVTELVNETLKRVGLASIERITVASWLKDWLAGKEHLSAATRLGYEQAVREFLQYLGPHGEVRRLDSRDRRSNGVTQPPCSGAMSGCPGQVRTVQVRAAQFRIAQVCPAQFRVAQVRPAQASPAQVRPAQIRPTKVRLAQVRRAQIRLVQVRAAQVRLPQGHSVQVRLAEVSPSQVRLSQVRRVHVRRVQVHIPQVRLTQVRPD